MTAKTIDQILTRKSWNVGNQNCSGNGSVPLIEATPGRLHAPKMRPIFKAVAIKFKPKPPKISLTPPKVLRTPAKDAQIAPPTIPARMDTVITTTGEIEVSRNNLITPVVKIAPTVIWPSIPIFHNPAVKVASKPQVTNNNGTHTTKTLEMRELLPVAPSHMSLNASIGLEFTNKRMMETNKSENIKPPN